MPEVIYKNDRWLIETDPTMAARPDLVRFLKRGTRGQKLLDQIAQWTAASWDSSRWIPRPPMVSQSIIDLVERHMRKVQP